MFFRLVILLGIFFPSGLFASAQRASVLEPSMSSNEICPLVKNFLVFDQAIEKKLQKIVTMLANMATIGRFSTPPFAGPNVLPKGILLCGPPGVGKSKIPKLVAVSLKTELFEVNCNTIKDSYSGINIDLVTHLFESATQAAMKAHAPSIIFLKNIDVLVRPRYGQGEDPGETISKILEIMKKEVRNPLFIIFASIDNFSTTSETLCRPGLFDTVLNINLPEESGRLDILKVLTSHIRLEDGIDLQHYATKTKKFSPAMLWQMVRDAVINSMVDDRCQYITRNSLEGAFKALCLQINTVQPLTAGQVIKGDSLQIDDSDFQGDPAVLEQLKEAIYFLQFPEKFAAQGATIPKGYLLEGPPGTGKTTLAKIIASHAKCNFINCCGSNFVNKYVGTGASSIREVFKYAKENGPSIIFIDEIDALLPNRSMRSSESGEASHATAAFLAAVDGIDLHQHPVVIIGATNRADTMDPAALRQDRLGKRIAVNLPNLEQRFNILSLYAKNKKLHPAIDLQYLAVKTSGLSGADLKAILNQAAITATLTNANFIEPQFIEDALMSVSRSANMVKNLGAGRFIKGDCLQNISFDSFRGSKNAKDEILELLFFLKNPEKVRHFGINAPKGFLLEGPSGTGKTTLAKIIAKESGCNFIAASGSEFVEEFVGVGAKRIRDLFDKARANAPCIVFIDELDALATHRRGGGGGSKEYDHALNELLVQLDGLVANTGVFFIGATNLVANLDQAVLRPGRIDRVVKINLPYQQDRLEILQEHAKGCALAADVDLEYLSSKTIGFSGADLANLINEAKIYALRQDCDFVHQAHLLAALDKVSMGYPDSSLKPTPKQLEETAYHEAGHALVCMLLNQDAVKVDKITILPRSGGSLGHTSFVPQYEIVGYNKKDLLQKIMVGFGGLVAEELIYGPDGISSGVVGDLQTCQETAQKMVCLYGMDSLVGPVYLNTSFDKLPSFVQEAIANLLKKTKQECLVLLKSKIHLLHKFKDLLLAKETVTGEEAMAYLGLTA